MAACRHAGISHEETQSIMATILSKLCQSTRWKSTREVAHGFMNRITGCLARMCKASPEAARRDLADMAQDSVVFVNKDHTEKAGERGALSRANLPLMNTDLRDKAMLTPNPGKGNAAKADHSDINKW